MTLALDSFGDSKTTVINIKSVSRNGNIKLEAGSTQTKSLIVSDVGNQAIQATGTSTQTEHETSLVSKVSQSFDLLQISDFLRRVEGLVSKQLINNSKSAAFQGYFVEWEEEIKDTSLTYTLSNSNAYPGSCITSLSWNATGSTLCATFACENHSDWCTHKGHLCAWNFSARDFQSDRPSFMAETSSCLMSIAFHPLIPSLVCGGTFTGQIFVWRITDNHDPVVAMSKISDFSHHEPITQLIWIKTDTVNEDYKIVSIGNDGRILEWSLNNKLAMPLLMSSINTKCIPRQLKLQSAVTPLGIQCISWVKDNIYEYLVGTETGFILRCSTKKGLEITKKMTLTPTPFQTPVVFSYSAHYGSCRSLAFSPFHRNLFLSCSSDGTLRLFNITQFEPILTWEPSLGSIVAVQWSTTRPAVFTCAMSHGAVLMYDLTISKTSCVADIRPEQQDQALLEAKTLSFNPSRREQLAVGMGQGQINIWKLKSEFFDQTKQDSKVLNGLGLL